MKVKDRQELIGLSQKDYYTHTKPNPYRTQGLQIIFEKSVSNRQMDMGRSRGATAPKNVISMWSALQVRLSKTGGD